MAPRLAPAFSGFWYTTAMTPVQLPPLSPLIVVMDHVHDLYDFVMLSLTGIVALATAVAVGIWFVARRQRQDGRELLELQIKTVRFQTLFPMWVTFMQVFTALVFVNAGRDRLEKSPDAPDATEIKDQVDSAVRNLRRDLLPAAGIYLTIFGSGHPLFENIKMLFNAVQMSNAWLGSDFLRALHPLIGRVQCLHRTAMPTLERHHG